MKENETNNGWGNKDLYKIPMTNLNFYNHNGSCPTVGGIDSFTYGDETYRLDDIVVVGGHIGNIEIVNLAQGVAGLGLSYEYEECMKNPYDWSMWSGFRCALDGIRHATDDERKKYEISAELTCDSAERADNAYKEKRIWGV